MNVRLVKFILIGGFFALCYLLGAYCLLKFRFSPLISSVITYSFLVPCAFILQKKFVFNFSGRFKFAFYKYSFLQFLTILISALIPFLFQNKLSHQYIFVFVIILNTFLSYFIQRKLIFKES